MTSKAIFLRTTGAIIAILWAIIYIIPNFVDVSKIPYYPGKKVNYGLDIQGGLHLVMGVDVVGVTNESTKRMMSSIDADFKAKGFPIKSSELIPLVNNEAIKLDFEKPGDVEKARAEIEKTYGQTVIITESTPTSIQMRYNDIFLADFKKKTLEQAIETIRNRIDEFGVAEPSITAQGTDRILVQLPGMEDSSKAKELINKTARLEFLIVDSKVDPAQIAQWVKEAETKGNYDLTKMKYSDYVERINKDLAPKLPKDTKILFEKIQSAENMGAGKTAYLVGSLAPVTGADLKSAQISFSQMNVPEVNMSFTAAGTTKFADATEKNVGKQLAIVLDDVIYAAPNVKERIGGGNARIELNNRNYEAAMNEAKMISMALRAGALPAKLEQLEERTVGPSLGQDSIKNAQKALAIGCTLLLIFMLVWYKGYGVIANVALIFNAIFILAVLSALNATITLPGVAGIALTIAMAVDANIIIFERIKEELKKGLSSEGAMREGYNKAFSAIFDANITNVLVAAVLMYYGTGPVRGFAVTLIIGIATTMFTAVFLTRTIAEFLIFKLHVKKIAI